MWIISPEPSMAHRYLMVQVWMPADRINDIDDIELYSVDGYPMESGMPPPFDDLTCHRMHANTNGFAAWEMVDPEVRLCYGAIWRNRCG